MWRVADLTAELGWPFEVLEDVDLVELWCLEHGFLAVCSARGVSRAYLVAAADMHRRLLHCDDA